MTSPYLEKPARPVAVALMDEIGVDITDPVAVMRFVVAKMSTGSDYKPPYVAHAIVLLAVKEAIKFQEESGR